MNELPEEVLVPKDKEKTKEKQHHHHKFEIVNIPKDKFNLFTSDDSYIYQKSFSNDLPLNINQPKMFHYNYNLQNLCNPDLLTMTFDLKKNCDILSDSQFNTTIHSDFINNTLELIIPQISNKIPNKLTENQISSLKSEIIEIVNKKEETEHKPQRPINMGYYSKNEVVYNPNSKTEKNYGLKEEEYKFLFENDNKDKDNKKEIEHEKQYKNYIEELKQKIDNTFIQIKKVNEEIKHPTKKDVTVKQIYDIKPSLDFIGTDVYQYIFPTDPTKEIKLDEHFEIPKRFIVKKQIDTENQNVNNEYLSLYKQENLIHNNINNSKYKAEFYSYEKDYKINYANDKEIFNRYLILLKKDTHTAEFIPLKNKLTLKKYKKGVINLKEDMNDDEDVDYNYIGNKRQRNFIAVPQTISHENLFKKKSIMNTYGYIYNNVDENVVDYVDYQDVEDVKYFKSKLNGDEESNNDDINNKDNFDSNNDNDLDKEFENSVDNDKAYADSHNSHNSHNSQNSHNNQNNEINDEDDDDVFN